MRGSTGLISLNAKLQLQQDYIQVEFPQRSINNIFFNPPPPSALCCLCCCCQLLLHFCSFTGPLCQHSASFEVHWEWGLDEHPGQNFPPCTCFSTGLCTVLGVHVPLGFSPFTHPHGSGTVTLCSDYQVIKFNFLCTCSSKSQNFSNSNKWQNNSATNNIWIKVFTILCKLGLIQ